MELKDKVAIITGAGKGGGEGIARVLAREGAKIVVVDLNFDDAQRVAASIDPDGGRAIAIRADVARKADTQAMADQTLEAFGVIDILVNNAGVGGMSALVQDVTEENWDRVMGVNAKGILFCCQAVIPATERELKRSIASVWTITDATVVPKLLPESTLEAQHG